VGKRGYGYWHQIYNLNATTTPEQWSPPDYGGTCTWSHPWGSVPGHVIPQSLFGVTATAPAHATLQIRPLPGKLEHGIVTVPTIRGAVTVEFRQENFDKNGHVSLSPREFQLRVVLPPNVKATVLLPALDDRKAFSVYEDRKLVDSPGAAHVNPLTRAVHVSGMVGSGEHHFALRSQWK